MCCGKQSIDAFKLLIIKQIEYIVKIKNGFAYALNNGYNERPFNERG